MAGSTSQYLLADGEIALSPGRDRATLTVRNTGDRPIQIGSHYHFFEANAALGFDRAAAFGMHLDIPAGTAARFEPGDERAVSLVAFGGARFVYGFNGLTNGETISPEAKARAVAAMRAAGFTDDGADGVPS